MDDLYHILEFNFLEAIKKLNSNESKNILFLNASAKDRDVRGTSCTQL